MSLPIYQRTGVTNTGDVIPGAEVTVVNESTGLTQTVYSNRTGTTALTQPFFADSNGLIQFYIPAGVTVRVTATGGSGSYTDRYVQALHLTESATDTTAGRVLKVGDGGLLGATPPFGSLPSDYIQQNTFLRGNPFAGVFAGHGLNIRYDVNTESQLIFKATGSVPEVSVRSRSVSDFSPTFQLYHTGNLNTLEFGGVGIGKVIARGEAVNSTVARFYLPIDSTSIPVSITTVGTFDVVKGITNVITNVGVAFSGASSNRMCVVEVTTTGLTAGDQYNLRQNSASSKITVNP